MKNVFKKWLSNEVAKTVEKKLDCCTEVHIKELDARVCGPAIEVHINGDFVVSKSDILEFLKAKEE